ncbi:MAG: hypothetical protein H7210_09245, partial [Pyrinomonadaceae bacterium]|nr:hypothetical protein [Phycisphaerales bacterium]
MSCISRGFLVLALITAALGQLAHAQPCFDGQWLPGDGLPGVNGYINQMQTWDPDGPGPRDPELLVWGSFTAAGTNRVTNIATWNGTRWAPVGGPIAPGANPGSITAVTVMPNNDLIALGSAPGATNQVSRWNGSSWESMGFPTTPARSVVGLPDGRVVVGTYNRPYIWDGATWSLISGAPLGSYPVLAVLQDGSLVAAIDDTAQERVMRWDGSTWTSLGTAQGLGSGDALLMLRVLANGDLIAGGFLTSIAGVPTPGVARWNGSTWSSLGTGTNLAPIDSTILLNGDLVVTGPRVRPGPLSVVSRWDGAQWSPVGTRDFGSGHSIATMPDGSLAFGGQFQISGDNPALNIVRLENDQWVPLQTGNDGAVQALLQEPDGSLLAAGSFRHIGGTASAFLARRVGATWTPVPNTVEYGPINALTRRPTGEVIAAGNFTMTGPPAALNIARRNGASWLPLG